MKHALKFSLCANVVLAAGLGVVVCQWPRQSQPVATVVPAAIAGTLPAAQAAETPVVETPDSERLRWNQIESPDSRAFVKNLRAIGCPEATVKEIITGQVNQQFNSRSQEIEKKLAGLANAPLAEQLRSEELQQSLRGELQSISGEQSATLAALFNTANRTSPGSADAAPASQAGKTPTPSLPLAFQEIKPGSVNLDALQAQAVADTRQRFVEQIGGLNQDPNDPAYLDKWQAAQPDADELMRGMIGWYAYENYELAASAQAQSSGGANP